MEKNSKSIYIFSVISIFILFVSLIFAAYVFFSSRSNDELLLEKQKLEEDLAKISKTEEDKVSEYEKLLNENKSFDLDFKAKYGFSPSDDFKSVLNQEIDKYKKENNDLIEEIKNNIKSYSKYYEGSYYASEELDSILSDFTNLSKFDNYEKLSDDLYRDLNIAEFIDYAKSDGSIKYLNSKNSWSRTNNIYLFATTLYSQNLNAIANNLDSSSLNLNKITAEIDGLYSLYKSMEELGLNTADLSSSGLLELKNKNDDLSKKYFENKGIIELLENVGKNDEQFK